MLRMGVYLRRPEPRLRSADNLHRIAISNLDSNERNLTRWWQGKYRVPPKPIADYTEEELYVEHLEDHYERFPRDAANFLRSANYGGVWDGSLSPELEREQKARHERLAKKKGVDIKKYQSEGDADLTDDQMRDILANVGKNLPGSRVKKEAPPEAPAGKQAAGEFEDTFNGR